MTITYADVHGARDYGVKCADIAAMLVRLHHRIGAIFPRRIARENKRRKCRVRCHRESFQVDFAMYRLTAGQQFIPRRLRSCEVRYGMNIRGIR